MRTQLRFLCCCLALLCGGAASAVPLTGTLTVPSTAYPTLKDAIDSLNNNGVGTGGVTVSITTGNAQTAPVGGYRLGSTILNASTSATNTITINGNANTVTANVGTSTTADGMFYISGTDYVSINALNLSDAATNLTTTTRMEWGYVLCKLGTAVPYDGAQNDIINGCTITLNNAAVSNSTGIYVAHILAGSNTVLSTTTPTFASANSNNRFTGNTISGASYGVYLIGINNATYWDLNNQVGGSTAAAGNTFVLGGATNTAYGVYSSYDSTITVSNNNFSISSLQSATSTNYYVYPSYGKGDLNVNNNYFNLNCTLTSGSIYCFYNYNISSNAHSDQTATTLYSTHSISGNTFTGTDLSATSGSMYGIYDYYYTYCKYKKINNNNFNNINWGTSTGAFYGVYSYYSYAPYVNMDSNRLTNITKLGTSGVMYGLYNYDYPAIGGVYSVQGNTERNIKSGYYWYGTYAYASGTSNPNGPMQKLQVRNNVVDSVDMTAATGTHYVYGIYAFYGGDTSDVTSNRVTNITMSAAGTGYLYDYFGYAYYGQGKYEVRKNVLDNIKINNGYAYNYVGYYYPTLTDSNTVSNITHGYAGGSTGGITTYLGYYSKQTSNNTIYKLSLSGGTMYNYVGYYGKANVFNNTIKNIANTSGTMYNYMGYYCDANAAFTNNRVDSMYSTGGTLYPWYSYIYYGDVTFDRNIVTNIYTGSTTAPLYGMYIYPYNYTTLPTMTLTNNIVSNFYVPSTYSGNNSVGIMCYPWSGNVNFKLFHNTVAISPGTTGATGFGWTGIAYYPAALLDLRNNIINVNVTPNGGYTAALRRTSGTASTAPSNFLGTSNANVYYAPNVTGSYLYAEGSSLAGLVNTYSLANDPNFNTPCGAFKTFVGHDNGSATENNLVTGSVSGTYLPSTTVASYASNGAVVTNPTTSVDYLGVSRNSPADIGALEFTGISLDAAPPAISFTPLPAGTYCTLPQSLTALITDASYVRVATGNAPRLYYKKSTESNTFGANTSSTSGWKYVEFSSRSGNNYTFNFDYTLLTSTLAIGDSITYFVMAMDSSVNSYAGGSVVGFSSCPTSVNLSSTNGGSVNAAPTPYGFKVYTTPSFVVGGVPAGSCGPGSQSLTLTPNTLGANIQWQSATLTGTFANISGATNPTYQTGTQTATMLYRALLYCGTSTTALATSNVDTFVIAYPGVTATTPASRCGYGTVTLGATTTSTSTPRWYATATGGAAIATGTTYTTPNINASTTYYVTGVTQKVGTEIATKVPATYSSTYGYGLGIVLTFRSPSTDYYSTTVYPSGSGTFYVELKNIGDSYYSGTNVRVAGPFTVSGGSGISTPVVLPLNWLNIPAGQYYVQMAYTPSYTGSPSLLYEYNGSGWPYPYYTPSGNTSIDNGYDYGVLSSYYAYFYYNTFSGECESSPRTAVTATVTPAPVINVSSNKNPGICQGDTATLTATSANTNYSYTWNPGSILGSTINVSPTTQTTYRVVASDPYTGCAASDTVRLFVNPKPAPPAITPVSQTICQKSNINLISSAPPGVSQTLNIGNGTGTNGQYYSFPSPYANYYPYNHEQYLITAAELTAAGQRAGNLTCIGFNIQANTGAGSVQNFTIKVGGTTATNASTTLVTGLTTVYSATSYTFPSTAGWTNIPFITPYVWNGTDNVIVDISNGNTSCGTTCYCSSFSQNVICYTTTTSFTSTAYYYGYDCSITNASPSTATSNVYASTTTLRPNMRICGSIPAPITWLNTTGLYTTSALTTAIQSTDTNKSVYASPMTTQVYQTIANVQGCSSNASAPDTLFVLPAPNVTVTPASALICAGDSVTLSVPTGSYQSFQWYGPSGAPIAGANSTTFRASGAGQYRVYVQNLLTGCGDTGKSTITVNPRPVITVAASGATTFCNGGNVVLTATSSPALISYQWQRNGASITTGGTSATYTATLSGVYRVYGVTSNGCVDTSTNSVMVNVNKTPDTVTASGSTSFCPGGSVTLCAATPPTGTTYTYQWYNASGAITGQTSACYTASATGNYYATITNTTTGCTSTSAVIPVSNSSSGPSSAITPSGNVAICSGTSTTLTTNPGAGLTYQWYNGTTPVSAASGGTTNSITVTTAGSYTVKVTITGTPSCTSQTASPTVVTVNPLPTPSVTTSRTTICQNDSTIMMSNTASGLQYQWNFNGNAIATNATGSTYAAKISGSYTVTQKYAATGCAATSSATTITVNPLPAVTVSSNTPTTFCAGGSVTLNASPTTGLTYVWSKNFSPISPAQTSSSYTATQAGTYTVDVTDNTTTCKNTSTPVLVQVNAKPVVTTTPASTANACQGGTTTISVPVAASQSYQWINGATPPATVASTSSYTTGTAGNYRAIVVNTVTGCRDTSAPVTVVINPLPTAVASLVGNATICQNDSTKIRVTTDIGTKYQWYANNTPVNGANDSTYYAKVQGGHYAVVTSPIGCTKTSNTVAITVNPVPPAYITYSSSLEFCQGSAVVLNANAGANLTYQWLYNGAPTGNTGTYNISNLTGTYALKTTNQFNCSTISDTLAVLVHPAPIPAINQVGNVLQTAQPYAAYQWFFNNVAIGGATGSTYSYTQNGAYKVHVVDAFGCEGTSTQFFLNNLGINNTGAGASIRVYPNPATNVLHIDTKMKVRAVLRDITGKAVIETSEVKDINLGDIASGMYLLYISDMDGQLLKAEKVTKSTN